MITSKLWIIERADTGEALGQFARGDDALEFGGRAIVYWSERRFARKAWIDYCIAQGWIRKGVTLGGGEKKFARGATIEDCPRVNFRQIACVPTDGVVPFGLDDLKEMTYDAQSR